MYQAPDTTPSGPRLLIDDSPISRFQVLLIELPHSKTSLSEFAVPHIVPLAQSRFLVPVPGPPNQRRGGNRCAFPAPELPDT